MKTKNEHSISNNFVCFTIAVIILLTALLFLLTTNYKKKSVECMKQQELILQLFKEKAEYQKIPKWYLDAWKTCTDETQVPKERINECLSFEMKLHSIK